MSMEKASSVHNENTPLLGQCIFYLRTPPPPPPLPDMGETSDTGPVRILFKGADKILNASNVNSKEDYNKKQGCQNLS